MKRTLTGIASAALLLSTLTPAAFAATVNDTTYSDISGSFAAQAITTLTADGYIHGFSNGTYRPTDPVTRGQFLAYFMKAMESVTGVKPVAQQQYFADIPPGNWAFNFVGAAEAAKWINPYWMGVRPGYNFNENYHASRGDAAALFVSAMVAAGKLQMSDLNGMSPLKYAYSIGLFSGLPSTEDQIYMNRADAAVVLDNIIQWTKGQLLPTGAVVSVKGASTNLGPNSNEALTVSAATASGQAITLPAGAQVTWSVDNQNGFINGTGTTANLVVTQPGTYNVTATVDGVQSKPFTVNVYGNVANIKLSAAQSNLVANGVSTDVITATAVDANGNTVGNYNGTATVTVSGSGANIIAPGSTSPAQASDIANGSTSGTYTLTFTNGVATFNAQAGTTPGLTETYSASLTPPGATTAVSASTTVTTVAQVASALKVSSVTGSTYVSANQASPFSFNVEVVDQNGQPMLTGTYPYNISVTGAGTYSGSATGVFFGNGTTTPPPSTVTVNSEQGVQGTITVNVSAQGLTSGSGTVKAVIAQQPVKFTVASPSGSSLAEGSTTPLTFDLTPVDVNGYPATYPSADTFTAYVTNSSGAAATNIEVNGAATPSAGTGVALASGATSLNILDATNAGANAGTYTVTIKDQNGNVWATFPVTVTAGSLSTYSLSSSAAYVSESSPTVTLTAQLQDAYGNNVAQAGVPIAFSVSGNLAGTGTINGAASPVTVDTNANGQATATLTMQPYAGEVYTVSSSTTQSGVSSPSSIAVSVEPTVASTASVTLQDANTGSNILATAGDTVTGTVYLKDQYGNPVDVPQTVTLTVNGGLSINTSSLTNGASTTSTASPYTITVPNGYFSFQATATTAGAASVSATDSSVSPAPTGSGTITVNANVNNMAGWAFFNAQGQEITSTNELAVAANTPTEVFLRPVDGEGNALPAASNGGFVTFSDGSTGQFRVGSNVAASASSVFEPVGTVEIPVWYVNSTAGSYDLSAASNLIVQPAKTSATVTNSVYQYAGSVTVPTQFVGFSAGNVTVTGYMYNSNAAAAAAPTAGQFIVTPSTTAGKYDVTIWSSSNAAAPTISYN